MPTRFRRLCAVLVLACQVAYGAYIPDEQSRLPVSAFPGVRDFDLRGDARVLFEGVAGAYGMKCRFDSDYQPGASIRFRLESVDFASALRALEESTASFTVPLGDDTFLVVKDTPQKRGVFEPYIAVTVDIPQAANREELTNLVTAVQQTMAIDKIGIDAAQNRVVIRGPVSKVGPARVIFESLLNHHAEVSIELELIEVSRNDLLVYGLDLPTVFQIASVDSLNSVKTSLAALARGGLGGMFSVNIGNAALLAQLQQSAGKSLMKLELRSRNNLPVTFHAGDRYPVVTAGFVGGTPGSGPGQDPSAPQPVLPSAFGSTANPSGLVVADFNGDGVRDFAATATDADSVDVYFGRGDGTFDDPVAFATGRAPAAIASADVNSDGRPDLITANSGANSVSVLLGRADGTFDATTDLPAGSHPAAVVIADFNRDGFPDLATANTESDSISLFFGDGKGAFTTASPLLATSGPRAMVAADLNADGRADLAVVNSISNDLWIFFSNGDGTFRPGGTYPTGANPVAIAAGDLSLDGAPDLAVVNTDDNTVSLFIADGSGGFAAGVAYAAGSGPAAVALGDFNRDSVTDVLVASRGGGGVILLPGLGNGGVQSSIRFQTGTLPGSLAIADLNSDAVPDVLVANPSSDNFSVLLGASTGGFEDSSGQDYPATGQSFTPIPQFNFEDLGLVVKATPHVNGVSDVTLDLEAEFKALTGRSLSGIPVISNRKLASTVRLRNGEWALVSGLLTTSDAQSITGLPIKVIAKHTRERTNTQVLILLRTNLVSLPPDEFVSVPVSLGSETRPRSPL